MSEKKDMLARVVEGVSDQHVGVLVDAAWKLRSQNPDEWARHLGSALRGGIALEPLPHTFSVTRWNEDPRDLIRTLNRKGKKVRSEVMDLFKGDGSGVFRIGGNPWTVNVEAIDPSKLWEGSWDLFPTQDQIIDAALRKGYRIPPVELTFFIAKAFTDAQLKTLDFDMLTVMHNPLVGKDGKKYRLWLNPDVDSSDEGSELSCYVGLIEAEGEGSEMSLSENGGLIFQCPV